MKPLTKPLRVNETGDRQRKHHHQGAIDRNPYQSVASQPQSPKQRKIMHKNHIPTPGSRNQSNGWDYKILRFNLIFNNIYINIFIKK